MAQVTAPRKTKQQVVMKPETVYGTDIFAGTYVLADVQRADSATIRVSPNLEEFLNLATAGHLGRLPSAIGLRTCRVSWEILIRGRGVAYSAAVKPEVDLPLRGCGLGATVTATTGVEGIKYQPSDTHEAMTIYVVQNIPGSATALAAQIVGAHGTWRLNGRAGGPMRFTFEYEGVLEEMADIPWVDGVPAPTPGYPTLKSALFQIGTTNYAPCIQEVDFVMGNQLTRVPCANAPSGLEGYMIADREPMLVIDPEADLEANSGWWAALQDGDPLLDCTWQLGSTQYNRMKWSARATGAATPAGIQVVAQEWVERDGLTALRTSLRPTLGVGNDDFSITFD